jgi:type II secretory pathway predicted ATPase ExeA
VTTTPSTPYEQLFQSFGLRENPFRVSADMRFVFLGRSYEATLAEMMFGIESRSGLLVLTGEPGTGKTMLLRRFLQWFSQRNCSSAYVFHSHLNTAGLFAFIARDFGIAVDSTKKSDLLAALQKWLQARQAEGDSPVIVIDEAQALSTRALDELCLLLNLENSGGKLVQIVLAGQPELDEKLRQPELRQLRQRIAVRCRLPVLTLEETEEYVASRLQSAGARQQTIFPPETIRALYPCAHGTPRVINLLCEKALLAAYAERQTVVSPANMRRVATELDLGFESIGTASSDAPPRPSLVIPLEKREPEPAATQGPATPVVELEEKKPEPVSVDPPGVDSLAVPVEPRTKPNVRVFMPKPAVAEPPIAQPAAAFTPPPAATAYRWRAPQSSFRRYWSEVAHSFVLDCRYFFSAFRTQSAADGKVLFMKKYDLHRDLVAPVSRWLSKPVSLKGSSSRDRERRTGSGHF